jgi:hypothetical protein
MTEDVTANGQTVLWYEGAPPRSSMTLAQRLRLSAHGFLTQLAHRAIAVGVWLLVGQVALTVLGRTSDSTAYLLPAAFGLFGVAAMSSLAVAYTSRRQPETFVEAFQLTIASAAFVVGTLAALIIARAVGH